MAVTVVVPGKIPDDKPMQATCRHCSCVFNFTGRDAKRINDQRDGDYYTIGCPTCGHQVTKAVQRDWMG